MLKLCYKNNAKRTDEYYFDLQSQKVYKIVSAKYCYVTHELRLHQNDRCKRFTLF